MITRSYGAMTVILSYLRQAEVTQWQALDRYWYSKGVGRIQTRIKKAPPLLYILTGNTSSAAGAYSDQVLAPAPPTLTILDLARRKRIEEHVLHDYDVLGTALTQIDHRTVLMTGGGLGLSFCFNLAQAHTGEFKWTKKMDMLSPRSHHSSCLHEGNYIYVTGDKLDKYCSRSAERYDIANDSWLALPNLNFGRSSHASCSLGQFVYVFCGQPFTSGNQNAFVEPCQIEKFDTRFTDKPWYQIRAFYATVSCVSVAQVSSYEIAIFGGQ